MPKLDEGLVKAIGSARQGFLRPSGWYEVALSDVEDGGVGPSGKPYWTWTFEEFILHEATPTEDIPELDDDGSEKKPVVAEPGTKYGGKLWHNTSLAPEAAWKLGEAFAAFNAPPDTDTDELIGKRCAAHVGQEIQQKGKAKGQVRNVILELAPLERLDGATNGDDFDF